MVRRITVLLAAVGMACAASAGNLLTDVYQQSREQAVWERLYVLWDLATAATATDAALSAQWSLEMYDVATRSAAETRVQSADREASRKNALTVLCLTDPARAAEHFMELEPSPGHMPNEDPRIDLARHLIPRLWAVQGVEALPTIRRFAEFTSKTGQYPYESIGAILPALSRANREAARDLFREAVNRLPQERILRTKFDYLKFLRAAWPVVDAKDRRRAVEAGLAGAIQSVRQQAAAEPGLRVYTEYYLPGGTVRFDSAEVAQVYDLLPFVDALDKRWGHRLREQYPALGGVATAGIRTAPWRSSVQVTPERDTPARVQAAFERHHAMFLGEWAGEDARRAARIALATQDPDRRRMALAVVLPQYGKIDLAQASAWRTELAGAARRDADTGDFLSFLVALARADFALGYSEDGREIAGKAMELGKRIFAARARELPILSVDVVYDLHSLADGYGAWDAASAAEFVRRECAAVPELRVVLLAAVVRGDARRRPGYREPT